jgi:AcrR family transcriptional regulator
MSDATALKSPRDAEAATDADEDALEDIGALFEDEYARAIIRHASEDSLSARDLMDRCDASKATIYRRIDRLEEYDLLESRLEHDPDGHHRRLFAATLDEVTITVTDGGFELSLVRSSSGADAVQND